ncbi:glycogen/starch/alpha-glucan phosphorylase [Celerinatantimonas sp. YJH-8]|uniref:glycogen/starch/alpha-glucan phosphorylase n=1 Tax=Celerinatantimonas sp. YJH-8 TaxID=3228714 RepID=UPI0038C796D8
MVATPTVAEDFPFFLDKTDFKDAVIRHLRSTYGTDENKANATAWWKATCSAINEQVFEGLTETQKKHASIDTRAVHYLSLEFLMGRLTRNNLYNLGLFETARDALAELGQDIDSLCREEQDMALGNGGLGRLAACFIDSLATLGYPAIGYGIHYENGLFRQEFRDGRQIERPDSWRDYGNPWEICRPESIQKVPLYGYVETKFCDDGKMRKVWHPGQVIKGVPWDIPVVGYRGHTVNILRLWESRADDYFDWDVFNAGGYVDAQIEKSRAETISKVLYPNDETPAGKELRLIQQYFFCACSLKDMMRRYKRHHHDFSQFASQIVIQLNDTHPTIAIVELMRLLVDEEDLDWDNAWDICQSVFAYTNHTLLPEALEKWAVGLFENVLPRHLEIIYEINRRFLEDVVDKKWPGDSEMKRRLSIIEEGETRMVRMAYLCVVGSFKVNGVAQMHSELVKKDLFPDFYQIWPDRFTNVTNGITPRRWLKACNPRLSGLLDEKIGKHWPTDLGLLRRVLDYANDPHFQHQFMQIKQQNKEDLAVLIQELTGVRVDAQAIFDIQIKRLHEYKRQHLNMLHILTLYRRLLENPELDIHPRVFIFGAKAAPGYRLAKDIIFAINKIADRINHDIRIKDKLKVVFLPNYRVSLAEVMIPAGDVSEQISTAGKEASGTGNMKFALNGAVTIGTMDGANVEIREEVGDDNIFIFGLTDEQVAQKWREGYNSWDYYFHNAELKAVLDWLDSDYFTPGEPGALASIKYSLLNGGDPFMCLADYQSYVDAQQLIDEAYRDKARWAKMAIVNMASVGKFNSDRSIEDYVANIWHLKAYPGIE